MYVVVFLLDALWDTQRYCIQDEKSLNYQQICSITHETPSLLPRNVNKGTTAIINFTNKDKANKRNWQSFSFSS